MSDNEFRQHLEDLGIAPGARLCVHSRLLTFGKIEGGVKTILDALIDFVGPEGALSFPTFTLHLGESDVYDPDLTPSRGSGSLGEQVRVLPGFRRTLSPFHSFSVHGLASEVLLSADWARSVGTNSVFDAMARSNYQLLLLGCSFQEGATYLHQVEAEVGVDYRAWISLPRTVRVQKSTKEVLIQHYARREGVPATDLTHIEMGARSDGCGRFTPVSRGPRDSYLVSLAELNLYAKDFLTNFPHGLLERV